MKKWLSLLTPLAVAFILCLGAMGVFTEKAFADSGDLTVICPVDGNNVQVNFYYEKNEGEPVGHLYYMNGDTKVVIKNTQNAVTYSAIKNTASPSDETDAIGPEVEALLKATGFVPAENTKYLVTVKSNDGKNSTFTWDELFKTERYTFPNAKMPKDPEEDGFAVTEAQKEGAVAVPVIIDLAISKDKPANTFCFGQVSPTERTRPAFVKNVISTKNTTPSITVEAVENYEQISNESDAVVSVPNNSTIEIGTEIRFGGDAKTSPYETENTPLHNLYYTTDGSEPTLESGLYNWYSYYQESAEFYYKYNSIVADKLGTLKIRTKAYRHGYLPNEKTFTYHVVADFAKIKGQLTLDKTKVVAGSKPSATVKAEGKTLKANTDYTVNFGNYKKVGTATVAVTGKGNYIGKLSKTYKVIPAKAKFKSVKAGKKKATIVIVSQKASGVTKYQIAYKLKTAKKWKTTTTTSTKKVIKKLKKGKKYNFKVRAYGKTGYGAYSAVKTIKIKKK